MTIQHDPRQDPRQKSPNILAVASGAIGGALAIYIIGTPGGRQLLESIIGALDDFSYECARFSQACTRARVAAASTINTTGGERETVF